MPRNTGGELRQPLFSVAPRCPRGRRRASSSSNNCPTAVARSLSRGALSSATPLLSSTSPPLRAMQAPLRESECGVGRFGSGRIRTVPPTRARVCISGEGTTPQHGIDGPPARSVSSAAAHLPIALRISPTGTFNGRHALTRSCFAQCASCAAGKRESLPQAAGCARVSLDSVSGSERRDAVLTSTRPVRLYHASTKSAASTPGTRMGSQCCSGSGINTALSI